MADGVVTAAGGRQWENELVGLLSVPAAPLTVVRRCVDVVEVLAVAGTGQAAAAVLSADLRRLTSDAVQRLHSSGVAVVGVHPAGDAAARARLEQIGVAVLVPDDAGATALAEAVRTAIDGLAADRRSGGSALGDPRAALLPPRSPDDTGPLPRITQDRPPGPVVAVWGPTGAPGRTTVALNLAAEWAETGLRVVLVDADTYGGVIASALGLLDESPGLAGACRLAANGRLDAAQLASLCWQVGPLRVLSGIARADRWPEVRPSAVPVVLDLARADADVVVVDCGFALEVDEELSFDTAAPRRNGATLAVLEHATTVLAVGACDPPGVERLVRGLAELAERVPDADPLVVLNKQRSSAAGPGESAEAVGRFAGLQPVAVLPEDRAGTDRAWQRGMPLSQVAPATSLRRGLRDLALRVLLSAANAAAVGRGSDGRASRGRRGRRPA